MLSMIHTSDGGPSVSSVPGRTSRFQNFKPEAQYDPMTTHFEINFHSVTILRHCRGGIPFFRNTLLLLPLPFLLAALANAGTMGMQWQVSGRRTRPLSTLTRTRIRMLRGALRQAMIRPQSVELS